MTGQARVRVMYVVPDLRIGGAERHVTVLMPRLDRRRFDAAVVCIGAQGALFGDLVAGGVPAVALHRSKRQAVLALRDLVREMRRFAPDVVITRGYSAEALGRIAAWLTRVPHSVVWVHNDGDVESRGVVRRVVDRVLDRVTSAYFGLARGQLDYMIDELKYSPDKIRLIPNGVELQRFEFSTDRSALAGLGIGESDRVVGIVAALRPEKDHGTFLRAARVVADRVPQAKFVIVGEGRMRPEIERLIDSYGLGDRVVLTGARSDVPQVLRALDVFVLSSFSVECFPNALLEAMAAGRPAVCTGVGGVPEILEDAVTGFLVPPRDPEVLADRLVRVLSDPVLAWQMGQTARARVESRFSLAASVATAEQALLDVAGPVRRTQRPIRLAVVLDLTFVGGVELLLLNLFKHLDPTVVTPRLVCLREAGPLADEFRAAGFDVEVLDRTGRFDLRTLPRLARSLRRTRTDAVMVTHHQVASLALGRAAERLARVPVNIVAVHSMHLTSIGRRALPRWAVNTLGISDALVFLSKSQAEYFHREEGVGRRLISTTREVVIPNGIQIPLVPTGHARAAARKTLGAGEADFLVGIVARLSPEKAHEVLFRAVAACAESEPGIRLIVIGGGPRDEELRELARELGIASRTTFLGSRRDVPDLLPGLDVACLSSVYEGVPITLVEAMAAGLPVVATDCGSVRDTVEEGVQGYVVPVGDVATFADRLQRLARDPGLRRRLGANGRTRAETEFRIEATARGYEDLLTELVAKRT